MKFSEISASDAVTGDLVSRVLNYSTILRNHAEFYQKNGDASTGRKEQGQLDIESRNLDSAYSDVIMKPEYFPVYRKFLGKTARLDVARELMGGDIPSEMQSQLRRFAQGIGVAFNNILINGDSTKDAKQFNGLNKLVLSAQTIKAGTNGLAVPMGISDSTKTSQQDFLEKIDATIETCVGVNKVIISNGPILARMNTIAREYIKYDVDSFGKRIASYNGIPLVNIEEGGASILPFSETVGTSTNCSSIYVVSFEEEAGLSFMTTKEGFKVYPMNKVSNWYEQMIELIVDSAFYRDKAIAKLSGIKLA